MKAFITGGTGFIGSHVIDYYLTNKPDIEIFALVRDMKNLKRKEGANFHTLEGNLFSIPSLPSDTDYVIHLAGLTLASNLADYYTVNQQGTASLFQSLQQQGIHPKRILYLSSLSAVGPSHDGTPVRESSPPHPITPYGDSKLKGEQEVQRFRNIFPVVILRASAVFGPRDKDFIHYFRFIKKGILLSLWNPYRYISLCYVKDLVRAIDICIQRDLKSGEIINIADPQPYRWDDIGLAAGKAMGKSLITLKIPDSVLPLFGVISRAASCFTQKPILLNPYKIKEMREKCWIADVRKAQEKLAFSPEYSLEKAIQETTDWYIQHRWM